LSSWRNYRRNEISMQVENMIVLNEFCSSHDIDISFVQSLEDNGLIEIIIVDQAMCITAEELPRLERIVRLHDELDINLEGIDVINYLLQRIEEMRQEIITLKNQLSFYREEDK